MKISGRKREKDRSLWVNISLITTIIMGLLAILYAAIDVLGLIDEASVLANRTDSLILFLVANIALFLISNYLDTIAKIENVTNRIGDEVLPNMQSAIEDRIAQSIRYTAVRFDNMIDLEKFQIKEMKKAKSEILDLSWSYKVSSRHTAEKDKKLDATYEDTIDAVSKKITYKEIFMFNVEGRKEKMKKRVQEDSEAYSCAYYENSIVPQFQFVVIDRKTVIFASSRYKVPMAIVNNEIGQLFANYYDELWEKAIKIKEGAKLNSEIYQKVLVNVVQ